MEKKEGIKFNGRIQINMLELNVDAPTTKGSNNNGSTILAASPNAVMLLPSECETIDVWGWVDHPCSTGCPMGQCPWAAQANFFSLSPAQRAAQGWEEGKSFMPFRSYDLISSTINCAAPAAVYPGGSGNTGGGGGGATTPNPPGDYNPCDDSPVATSIKAPLSRSIFGVPPSICDPDAPNDPTTLPPNDYLNAFQRLIAELNITNPAEIQLLQNNGNIFVALNNYLNANNWNEDSKDFGKWAVGYLVDFPDVEINELITNNNIPNANINLPNIIDVTNLTDYPAFKSMVENLPAFLNQNPEVLKSLSRYTGFSKTKIMQLMQPGKGPKIELVSNLVDRYGRSCIGQYTPGTYFLKMKKELIVGLDKVQSPKRYKALGMLLCIVTLHEFVHYGRDVNKMTSEIKVNGWEYDVGVLFELSISPPYLYDKITRNNAIQWAHFYNFNIND